MSYTYANENYLMKVIAYINNKELNEQFKDKNNL